MVGVDIALLFPFSCDEGAGRPARDAEDKESLILIGGMMILFILSALESCW